MTFFLAHQLFAESLFVLSSKQVTTFFFAHQLFPESLFYPPKQVISLFFCLSILQLGHFSVHTVSDRPWRPKSDRPTGKMPGVPVAQSTSEANLQQKNGVQTMLSRSEHASIFRDAGKTYL